MHEVKTEIELKSKPELVWQLLTTFELYERWNPLFREGSGTLTIGSRVKLKVELPGIPQFSINPDIKIVEPQSRLVWRYCMGFDALFVWEYDCCLETLGDQHLKFTQTSLFKGILAPIYTLALKTPLLEGCNSLNGAVRRWGERGNITCMKC